jgi:hypothetical protein
MEFPAVPPFVAVDVSTPFWNTCAVSRVRCCCGASQYLGRAGSQEQIA